MPIHIWAVLTYTEVSSETGDRKPMSLGHHLNPEKCFSDWRLCCLVRSSVLTLTQTACTHFSILNAGRSFMVLWASVWWQSSSWLVKGWMPLLYSAGAFCAWLSVHASVQQQSDEFIKCTGCSALNILHHQDVIIILTFEKICWGLVFQRVFVSWSWCSNPD